MVINLKQFAEEMEAVVPVMGNRFQFKRKVYKVSVPNGWYKVKMQDNDATVLEEAFVTPEDFTDYKLIQGYTYHNNVIFQNFDVAKRLLGEEGQAQLELNQHDTFSSILLVKWEDKKLYPISLNYNDLKIYEVKDAFDNEQEINSIKGVTPELKTVFLLHEMQRKNFLEELRKAKEAQDRVDFLRTLPGRIEAILKRANGVLIGCEQVGNNVIVDWKVEDGRYEYNTVIDLNTFQVKEAGFCMTGDDRRHNLTSLALTAKQWEGGSRYQDTIHITRRRGNNNAYYDDDDYDDEGW